MKGVKLQLKTKKYFEFYTVALRLRFALLVNQFTLIKNLKFKIYPVKYREAVISLRVKLFNRVKILSNGITLIELTIVIFLIVTFSMILIADFPKIQKQFALSRVTYKLEQDFRRTEDLGLSGVTIQDSQQKQVSVTGYGIYVNTNLSETKYLIYADTKPNINTPGNNIYDSNFSTNLCSLQSSIISDCPIEITDLLKENPNLFIKDITDNNSAHYSYASINFNPPNPNVIITTSPDFSGSAIGIIFSLRDEASARRIIWVYKSGLISVQ